MLRRTLLAASHSGAVRKMIETAPVTREVVQRFIAGETAGQALRVTRGLLGDGLLVTLDRLGEDTLDAGQAEATVQAYERLLRDLPAGAEVSVKLTALGQAFDEALALENARRVCKAAAHTTVTLDMEDHTTVASTLRILRELREDHPDVGAVIQAYLRRAEEYCAELSYAGSRVRLCKGAYAAPAEVAFTSAGDVDRSYVRCMKVLMAGQGYPMLATHDPRLIEIADALRLIHERGQESYEYQMLYGIRPLEQRRLAAAGCQVRVYVPYGHEWYGYMVRRLAERPANVGFFLRSFTTRA
ncbi:MAG: proline dehydrogenase family protein [Streptosporangiaceae bacterium]